MTDQPITLHAELPGAGSAHDECATVIARLGPVADRLGSRASVAQYEADINDPARTRAGTSLVGHRGPLPRFLPVRDIIRIAFNIESLVPAAVIPDRQARSTRSPTDDNLALALPYAPSLRSVLELVARYGDAVVPWYQRSITQVGDALHIAYWPLVPLGRIEALATEVALGTIHRIVEAFVGDRVKAARVVFAVPPVSGPSVVAERFACHIEMGGPRSCMIIPAEWGALPSPYYDPILWLEGVARCEADIAALHDTPLVGRVRGLVRGALAERRVMTVAETSRALGMAARSLVRGLTRDGVTHHQIVDMERKALAQEMLALPTPAISDVAEALGFADQSSFGRKCRAWFGDSPALYRRRLVEVRQG
jgi:AraC-like DNA-binding protein